MGHYNNSYLVFGTVIPDNHKYQDEGELCDTLEELEGLGDRLNFRTSGDLVLGAGNKTVLYLEESELSHGIHDVIKLSSLKDPEYLAQFATFCRDENLPEPTWTLFSNFG